MITIYANWTGAAIVSGTTLDDARAKLTALDCQQDTVFGDGLTDMTALDTGPHDLATPGEAATLSVAQGFFPLVSAVGLCRPGLPRKEG